MTTAAEPARDAAAAPRLRLDDVSLLCVETRRPHLAVQAMERCLRGIDFGECLLLSPRPIAPHPQIRHVEIPEFDGIAGYSEFMVRRLGRYFSRGHALVAQWDGFITDAARWDPRFLDVDYIGAPWPDGGVGNGGFSLRSRRLVDTLARIDVPAPHPEDVAICIRHRDELERHGVRFAPPALARRFSWEAVEPDAPAFGFHGFFNFHRALAEDELVDYLRQCDDALLQSVPARRLLKQLYRSGMHQAAAQLLALRMRGPLSMRLDGAKLRGLAWLRAAGGRATPRPAA